MGERGNEYFDDGFSCKDPQKVADRIKEMLKDRTLSQDEITELNSVAEKLASSKDKVIKETVNQLQILLSDQTFINGVAVEELKNKLNGKPLSRDIVLDSTALAPAQVPTPTKTEKLTIQPNEEFPLKTSYQLKNFTGKATESYENGTTYQGQFKNGAYEGKGIFILNDGNKYEGQFKNGAFGGKGTYTFSIGDKYEGQFKDWKFEGKGTYTFSDGEKNEGTFKDDKIYNGIKKDKNGKILGDFKDGKYTERSESAQPLSQVVPDKLTPQQMEQAVNLPTSPTTAEKLLNLETSKNSIIEKFKQDLIIDLKFENRHNKQGDIISDNISVGTRELNVIVGKNSGKFYLVEGDFILGKDGKQTNILLDNIKTKDSLSIDGIISIVKKENEVTPVQAPTTTPVIPSDSPKPQTVAPVNPVVAQAPTPQAVSLVTPAVAPASATKPNEGTLTIDQLNMDNFKVGDKLNLQLLNDLADLKNTNPKNDFEIKQLERRLDGVTKNGGLSELIKKCEAALSKLKSTERTKLMNETKIKITSKEPTNELPYLLTAFLEKNKDTIVLSGTTQPQLTQKPSVDLEKQKENNDYFYRLIKELNLVYESPGKGKFNHISGSHRVSISDEGFTVYNRGNQELKADGSIKTDKSLTYLNKDELKSLLTILNKPTTSEIKKPIEITENANSEFKKLGINIVNNQIILSRNNMIVESLKDGKLTRTNFSLLNLDKINEPNPEISSMIDKIDFSEGRFNSIMKDGSRNSLRFIEISKLDIENTNKLLSTLKTLNIPNENITINDSNYFTIKTQNQGDINISVSNTGFIVTKQLGSGFQQLNNQGEWEDIKNKHLNFVDIKALESGIKNLTEPSIKQKPVEKTNKENLTEVNDIKDLEKLKLGDTIAIGGLLDPYTRILLTQPIEIDIEKNQVTIQGYYNGIDTILKDQDFSKIKIFKIAQAK